MTWRCNDRQERSKKGTHTKGTTQRASPHCCSSSTLGQCCDGAASLFL